MEAIISLPPRATKDEIEAYKRGIIYGIWLYTWWKDGVQYVGTCGKTYKDAVKEVHKQFEVALNEIQKV